MEDDPALIIPQLWAGRMRRDAADALAFGCNGLIGIHWRTREPGPNIAALAKAAWSQESWNPAPGEKTTPENIIDYYNKVTSGDSTRRDLDTREFYRDWAENQFGKTISSKAGEIFYSLDGGRKTGFGGQKLTNLPRPADWVKGPGGLKPDTASLEDTEKKYLFLDQLESLRSGIQGQGNLERFDFWLNQFRYLREVGMLSCLLGQYNKEKCKLATLDSIKRKNFAETILVPIRKKEMETIGKIHGYLLQTITTKGTLGTLANWQEHLLPLFFERQEEELSHALGRALFADEKPAWNISLKTANILSAPQSVEKGDNFSVEILTLNLDNPEGAIFFKPPGKERFLSIPCQKMGRGVLKVVIPGIHIKYDFEYYVEIKSDGKPVRIFPATAPELNNMVTIR